MTYPNYANVGDTNRGAWTAGTVASTSLFTEGNRLGSFTDPGVSRLMG